MVTLKGASPQNARIGTMRLNRHMTVVFASSWLPDQAPRILGSVIAINGISPLYSRTVPSASRLVRKSWLSTLRPSVVPLRKCLRSPWLSAGLAAAARER
jgi:hypothetical protein